MHALQIVLFLKANGPPEAVSLPLLPLAFTYTLSFILINLYSYITILYTYYNLRVFII